MKDKGCHTVILSNLFSGKGAWSGLEWVDNQAGIC